MTQSTNKHQPRRGINDFYASFEIKAERLITALYMVTNFFSDKEPMKWKLRDAGLLLLSDSASLKDKNSSGKSETLVKLIYSMESIMALLEIARLADFISDMNYSVLISEFTTLKNDVERRAEVRESVSAFGIPEKFFSPNASNITSINSVKLSKNTSGTNTSNERKRFSPIANSPQQSSAITMNNRYSTTAINTNNTNQTLDKEIGHNKGHAENTRIEIKHSKRQNTILLLIQEKQELSIKDITAVIDDCSEKTIQRELVSMVDDGILKRTGERRWSKYSLNN